MTRSRRATNPWNWLPVVLLALVGIGAKDCGGGGGPTPPAVRQVAVQVNATTGGPIAGANVWWQPAPGTRVQTNASGLATLPVRTLTSGVCAQQAGFTTPGPDETPQTCIPLTATTVTLLLEPDKPPTPPVVARRGLVRANNHTLTDDDGVHYYYGSTLFWAAWGWLHDQDRVVDHLKWFQAEGIDYTRVLAVVGRPGDPFWGDRVSDPFVPGYDQAIAGLLDRSYELGLRTQLTIFGDTLLADTKAKRRDVVSRIAAIIAARPEKVFAVEVANEGYDNFEDQAEERDLARLLQQQTRNLVAVTAPRSDACADQSAWYGGNVGSLVTLHLARSWAGEGGPWRPVRQPWRESRFSCPGVAPAYSSNEPIGPQSSVQADDDPRRLGALAATTAIGGFGADVLHTGAGIRGQVDEARHRPANVWETPRIKEITGALRAVRDLLPPDVANWSRTSSTGGPFDANFKAIDRLYCAWLPAAGSSSGGRFACGGVNVHAATKLTARRAVNVTVYDTMTGKVVQAQRSLAKGDALTLQPEIPGVLLLGQ